MHRGNRRILAAFCAASLFTFGSSASAQTTHFVDVNDLTFDPPNVCIQVGDTVQWDWVSGFHNVESGSNGVADGNFFSGNPVGPPETFSVTFDQPFLDANPMPGNNYPYFCIVHIGFGMEGNVTVGCATAAAVNRNCAPNPNVYTSDTLPILGSNWQATVDASGHAGATSTLLVGYASDLKLTIGIGTILVNVADPGGQILTSFVAGGQAPNVHVNSIPNDLALNGSAAYTQGVILGGGLELTNAQDLTLGM